MKCGEWFFWYRDKSDFGVSLKIRGSTAALYLINLNLESEAAMSIADTIEEIRLMLVLNSFYTARCVGK